MKKLDWAAMPERAVLAAVLAIAALISYLHLREVWEAAGAPVADLGPLLVDGLFAAAWLRMRRRRQARVPVGWLAWLALLLALVATVAGNVAAAWISDHRDPLSLTVAAWPALVLGLVWELVTGHAAAPHKQPSPAWQSPLAQVTAPPHQPQVSDVAEPGDKAAELVAAGAGRRRLVKELGVTEWEAKKLLREARGGDVEEGSA